MTDVMRYEGSPLDERMRYAETLANAGDLIPKGLMYQPIDENTMAARGPKRPSPGKILLVMETGAMLGLHPVAALQGIHVIEGKASLAASTMSAVIRQAGHDLKVWTEGTVAGGDFRAVASLVRKGETFEYRSVWDAERATRAGLLGKDNWKNYFEAMCKNRAVSDVCRDGASDTLAGVIYTPDELGAIENDRGDIIDAPDAEPAAPSAAAKKQPAAGRQGTRKAPAKPEPVDDEPADENIVDAEVVEDDVPDPTAADAPEPDAVVKERVQAKRAARAAAPEPEPEPAADPATGVVEDEPEPVDDGPAAVLERDPAEPTEYEVATAEEPGNYERRVAAASTVAQVRAVWDDATAADALGTELRATILARKNDIEAAAR